MVFAPHSSMDVLTIALILAEVSIIVFIANRLGKAIHAGLVLRVPPPHRSDKIHHAR